MKLSWNCDAKLLKIQTLTVSLLVLQACEGSIQSSTEPPFLVDAPAELQAPCEKPVRLPERVLSREEVEFFWLNDREALIRCGFQKDELLAFYLDRDARIRDD